MAARRGGRRRGARPVGRRAGRSAPRDGAPRRCAAAVRRGDAHAGGCAARPITGAGVAELRGVAGRPPPRDAADRARTGRRGTVFAVDRDERGRRAWVRMWSRRAAGARPGRASAARARCRSPSSPSARPDGAGGRAGSRGPARSPWSAGRRHGSATPSGEPPRRRRAPVRARRPCRRSSSPIDPTRRTALYAGLTELADEDPLIDLHVDEVDGEAAVAAARRGAEGGAGRAARGAVRRPRPVPRDLGGVPGAGGRHGRGRRPDQASATTPTWPASGCGWSGAPVGHGVEFSPGIERGNLPPAFVAATEEGVRAGARGRACTGGRSPTAWSR